MSFFLSTVCSNHNVVWCAGVRLTLSQSSLSECVKARLIKKDDHDQHDLLCRTKAINESRNRNPGGLFERREDIQRFLWRLRVRRCCAALARQQYAPTRGSSLQAPRPRLGPLPARPDQPHGLRTWLEDSQPSLQPPYQPQAVRVQSEFGGTRPR